MLNKICAFSRSVWSGWSSFFFDPQSDLPPALFRFVFALNALVMYAVRFRDWRFYFTEDGFLPVHGVLEILPEIFRPDLTWYPHTAGAALAMNVGLIICLILLLVGFLPRVSALVGFILHVGLIQRNYAIAYGADFITTFMFFSLIFIQSDRRFSLTVWLRSRTGRPISEKSGTAAQIFSSAFIRIMQIQLCLIYMYTGLEKLKGSSWWDGSAIWAVIGNQQIMYIDASWIRNIPLLLAAMTFTTLLFEIYFTPLVWIPTLRKWVLGLGILMHLGIALSIGLFYFSFGMMSVYFLWADAQWLENLLKTIGIPRSALGPDAHPLN